jgi:hypothetical protein
MYIIIHVYSITPNKRMQVVSGKAVVLMLSAKDEKALKQAEPLLATVRPHALVQTHLEQLYVLVSKEHLHKIEQELKSIVSANKTLALKVHKLGEKFVRTHSFSCRPVSVYIV